MFLSVVTVAEVRQGISFLPPGRRREIFEAWLDDLRARYENRTIDITADIADRWGRMAGEMRAKGKPMPVMDGFIAATAIVHSCVVATRNIRHFEPFGIDVIDPWQI